MEVMIYLPIDKKLNVEVIINTDEEKVLIKNLDEKHLYIELFNSRNTFSPVCWTFIGISKHEFECNLKYINAWSIDTILISKNNSIHIYNFDFEQNKFVKLKPIPFDFQLPFVFMTGHSGGGTSIVAKSFKYLGINLGNDSGDFINRKNHESYSFRFWLGQIFSKFKTNDFGLVMSSYQYNPNSINAIKITDLSSQTVRLGDLFPNSKFISVVKHKSKNALSYEGKQFNNTDNLKVYKEQHPPVEGKPIFHIDWIKYFTDYQYVNKVLNFIGADLVLSEDSFNQMLEGINFDNSRLKQL